MDNSTMYAKVFKQSDSHLENELHSHENDLKSVSISSFADGDHYKDQPTSDSDIRTCQCCNHKYDCGDSTTCDVSSDFTELRCGCHRTIFDAVKFGHEECTRKFLDQGVDVNLFRYDGLNLLMTAIHAGQIKLVQLLLQAGINVHATNDKYETALHYVAGTGRSDCVDAMVTAGAEIDAQDQEGNTPLILATKLNDIISVAALIKCGANVSAKDHTKRSALHWAAFKDAFESAEILLKDMPTVEIDAGDEHGDSAFVLAIKQNAPRILQLLVNAGCDRNNIDGLMGTSLALASLKGHADVIELLVANCEDPDEYGYFGMTPLMLATFESHVDAVAALLRAGADVNKAARMGSTALHKSLLRLSANNEGQRHSIVALLLRAGSNVNCRLNAGGYFTACTNGKNCPLSFAVASGYISLVRMLLIAGSEVSHDEIKKWMELNDIQRFYDFLQLLGPVAEWKSEARSLMHCCRAAIRGTLVGKDIRGAILQLPLATSLKRYLDFGEFDEIQVERAKTTDGMQPGLMESLAITPCGMRALEGTLLHNMLMQNSSSNIG